MKKPRAFVAGDDLFDFSDIKIVTGSTNEKVPTIIGDKPAQIQPKEAQPAPKKSSPMKSEKSYQQIEKDYNLGALFQGKNSVGAGSANLNAKKLDINFDNDDFFNQFDPVNIAKQQEEAQREKERKQKEKEKKQKQMQAESEKASSQKGSQIAQQSSNNEEDVQAKYEQLMKSGATAISSDMLFGEQPKQQEGGRWSTPAQTVASFSEKL